MAERLAIARDSRLQIPDFTASSAGTLAVINHPIHAKAVVVLEKMGGNCSGFAARQLTPKIASNAELILTMTKAHRDSVLELAPNRLSRTFSLSEAAHLISDFGAKTVDELAGLRSHLGQQHLVDILDPVGLGPEVFTAVASQIDGFLNPIMSFCRSVSGGYDVEQ